MTLSPAPSSAQPIADWQCLPGYPDSTAAPAEGVAVYLHAFRRRWLSAIGIGVLCASLAGLAVWFSHMQHYTATALLRVASTQQPILFKTVEQGTSFDIYKNTQVQYLRSRFVLIAALRRPEIARLPVVQREEDPVAWLAQQIRVTFPGDGEIMQVSLTGENREEVAALVNAVVEAYMAEVVDVEQRERQQRHDELDRLYTETESNLRERRTQLRQLADQLGTGDSQAISLKQQIMLQQFSALRSELLSTEFRLMRLAGELKVKKAAREAADGLAVTELDLEAFAARDPQYVELKQREAAVAAYLSEVAEVAKPAAASKYSSHHQRELETIRKQMEARREALRTELKREQLAALDEDIRKLELEIATLTEQERRLQEDVDRAAATAGEFGGSSIDVEMQRAEISHLEKMLASIADEREKLRIELQSKPRVSLVQKAEVPQSPDRDRKLQLAILAALAAFVLPGCGIVWWDSRAQRINSAAEVSRGIGLDVIGAVPLIPAQAVTPVAVRTSRRHEQWRAMFLEAVNGIAARILRHAEQEQTRVILVSSAMGGEGKTTLASHLAMSLARTGHRTILVDFDLRRPAIDEVVDLPLTPGVSEVLRNGTPLEEAVHQGADPNLFILTAGRWGGAGTDVLANGQTGSLFRKLRDEYDFVIVDGSPILPVADTRFIAQHVDGVVLSILRDVSRIPKILATREILAAFGVRTLGAIVSGSASELYYRDPRYEARVDG